MICPRSIWISFVFVVFLGNDTFAWSELDTLIIDGQKVYLEEESVDTEDSLWKSFGSSDYRMLRPATKWGLQLELGGGWVNPSWKDDSIRMIVSNMNPKKVSREYTKSYALSGYSMLNSHWGVGAGFQQTQWNRTSELVNTIPQGEDEHEKVFGYYYDQQGFWVMQKVEIDLGLFELDTFQLATTRTVTKFKSNQFPMYAIYKGSIGNSTWDYQAQLGMVWTQIQAGQSQMSVVENTKYLRNISLAPVNEIRWSGLSKVMLRKKWFHSIYTFAAAAYQWTPKVPNPPIVGKINSPINLTFGMAWEY